MSHEKQLRGFSLRALHRKQQLDQALNAKEFALLAGVSYTTAREWLHLPGFPTFCGVVFWQDFVLWRRLHTGSEARSGAVSNSSAVPVANPRHNGTVPTNRRWPGRSARHH